MLDHYHAVLNGQTLPRYLETRAHLITADITSPTAVLWAAHDKKTPGTTSLLEVKIELANRIFTHCTFCERRCGVNRPREVGECGVRKPKISSEFAHYGEESVLVPSHTIFFSGCNFHCIYCQNWDISQVKPGIGKWIPPKKLAKIIEVKHLKNMNFVGGDPTPNLDYILQVLQWCNAHIPVVWNSNMYLTEKSMQLLEGVVDVYLTDFKYGNNACGEELSDVKDYFTIVSRNHILAEAQAELIIRHLVLPNHLECCTYPVLQWISENLTEPAVNVMFQYRPEYKAMENAKIDRFLTYEEHQRALDIAKEFGIYLI